MFCFHTNMACRPSPNWEVCNGVGVDGVGVISFLRFSVVFAFCCIFCRSFSFYFCISFSGSASLPVCFFFSFFFVSGDFSVFCTFPGSLRPQGKLPKTAKKREFRSDPVYTNPRKELSDQICTEKRKNARKTLLCNTPFSYTPFCVPPKNTSPRWPLLSTLHPYFAKKIHHLLLPLRVGLHMFMLPSGIG